MKILVAPQEFKGTLSAHAAASAIADGLRSALPDAEVLELPLSDGGPGFLECLVEAQNGEYQRTAATGPLGAQVLARWGLFARTDGPGSVAAIELAAVAGLSLLKPDDYRPLDATTYGAGELIWHALSAGAARIYLGVGGSATSDGGAGVLQALGARILDASGNHLPPGGGALVQAATLDLSRIDRRLRTAEILVATDVRNPLTGPQGAAAIYGPQKGATAEQVQVLESGLARWAQVLRDATGVDVEAMPGAGAAGGTAAGLVAACGARITSGFDLVSLAVGLREHLNWADMVVTGEGSFDSQSLEGKVTGRLLQMTGARDKRCLVLAGRLGEVPPGAEAFAMTDANRTGSAEDLSALAAKVGKTL